MNTSDAVTMLGALAHAGRLEIFRLLVRRAPDEVPSGEIALALGVRGSTMSNQLGELERTGLIRARRVGRSVRYRADLGAAGGLLGFLATECCRGRPEACLPIADAFLNRSGDRMAVDAGGRVFQVLFVCARNSARSILAEAILGRLGAGRFVAHSAGATPRGAVHPAAAQLLQRRGYDAGAFASTSWEAFAAPDAPPLDFVVTVCDQAANALCPSWPGRPMSAHWGVPDPAAATGAAEEIDQAFEDVYQALHDRIAAFAALPIEALDSLALQGRLDAIGREAGTLDRAV